MAIEIISGKQARQTLEQNKTAYWPSRQMASRLYPLATPQANASFKIGHEETIFCIGSCFAREIGEALRRLDFKVLSTFQNLPQSVHRKKSDVSMFNKYNVSSIYNELYWAFNPQEYSHDKILIESSDNRLQDYQLTGSVYADEPQFAKQFREAFNLAFQAVKQADIIIITLGLSEVWFDCQTQLYLNAAPSKNLLKYYPERFELHVFDYEKTSQVLEDIYTLLKTHLNPSFRLLITVSPIPLHATFREQDVLVANAYSKAVLRAAVEKFVSNKDNVNYFPSYEFVTLSNPTLLWRSDDFRHVDRAVIDYIMGNVMAQFTIASPTLAQANALAKATALYQGDFLKEAKAVLEPFIKAKAKTPPELVLLWNAVRLGIHGKYKGLLLESVHYLRDKTAIKPVQLLGDFIRGYRKMAANNFISYVEQWDGEFLTGWASCLKKQSPISIKIIADNKVLMTVLADIPRADVAAIYGEQHLYCGFHIKLNSSELTTDTLHIEFVDIKRELRNSPIILTEYDKNRLKQ